MDSILIESLFTEEKNNNYSTWMFKNNKYIPELNAQIYSKLPAGVYTASFDQSMYQYIITPIKETCDEIIYFDNTNFTDILNEIKSFWAKKDVYKTYNIAHKRGVLLQGAPGTGKTMLTNAIKNNIIENDGLVFIINSVQSMQYTAHVLSQIVRKIEPNRNIVTIIEDIDQMIATVGNDSFILDFLDGQMTIENQLVILTSNNTSELSEALLRPSRIDLKYEIPNPTIEMRRIYLENKKFKPELLDKAIELTEDYSFAKLKEVFIGVMILEKDLETVINQINNPLLSKDYLNNETKIGI